MTFFSTPITGAMNFRDCGGVLIADGRRIKSKMLFRSGDLHNLNETDFCTLERLGIKTIYDLRSKIERDSSPIVWRAPQRPNIIELDVTADIRAAGRDLISQLGDDLTRENGHAIMRQLYASMPCALLPCLGDIFSQLSHDNGSPCIISCTAGKDRTGALIALIMAGLTVSMEDIYRNYLFTASVNGTLMTQQVHRAIERIIMRSPPQEFVHPIASVESEFLDATFDAINMEWGSLGAFLRASGLSPSVQLALIDNLTE